MCDFSEYTPFNLEYHGNYKVGRLIFRGEFIDLKISVRARFTHFWTNIHPCVAVNKSILEISLDLAADQRVSR